MSSAIRKEVVIGDCRLLLGDCLDILPTLGKVDAVVTDPPYGVNFRGQLWDSKIPDWFDAARAIADSVVVITAPTTLWDYPRPDWLSCWYRPASSSRTVFGSFNHWSPIAIYGKLKTAVDVINLHAIANAYPKGFGHPSPKPVALMDWLVEASAAKTIVDPFLGSGTTGVACVKNKRAFIGIELDEGYFDLACDRIRKAYAQPDMFVQSAPVPVQQPLFSEGAAE